MKFLKHIVFNILLFSTKPVYSTGFEDVSLFKTILQLIFYLAIFGVVIFITLYGTKIIGKNYKKFNRSKYIQVIDAINIQNGTKLAIVNINKKIYILSISNTVTTVIDTIDSEDFQEEKFDSYLSKHMNNSDIDGIDLSSYVGKIKSRLRFSKDKEGK